MELNCKLIILRGVTKSRRRKMERKRKEMFKWTEPV
jgi:hypothetical protein